MSDSTQLKRVVCAHDCPDTCGLLVGVRDGRVVSVTGDPAHPITRGFVCGKVSRYAERVYSERRVMSPLRRIGAKGEGRFAPISWEEALAEIAGRFKSVIEQHGPEAILPFSYGGTIGQIGFNIGTRFFHALGASRLERTICAAAAAAGLKATMGRSMATDLEEVAQARLILVWGVNAVATHIHLLPLIKEARRGGAQVVVIDTYRTATARLADRFIPIRPGTDAALALGMMRVILEGELYDREFVENCTVGFPQLREAAMEYTPERVEAITGVPAAEVERLGREYGSERRSFIRMGLGPSRHSNGAMTVRTVACLPSLTGAWEARGGGFLCLGFNSVCQSRNMMERPAPEHAPARKINMIRLGEALLRAQAPPVKALYVYNSNPAATVPDQAQVHRGLAREELFVVVHEQQLTDTTDFADIVLPATTFMEHDDVHTSYGHGYVQISRPAIPPVGEAKSNHETFRLLARELGLEDEVLAMDFESLATLLLTDLGATDCGVPLEELLAGRPVKPPKPAKPWRTGLDTPSGKVEFFSAAMEARGLPPVPAFVPSEEGHQDNDWSSQFPLQLVTPPSQHFLNSSWGETPGSRRLERNPRLKLHPADAEARGLAEGDSCRAFNRRGECILTAEVTKEVPRGTAVAESIWWPSQFPGRKGINQLVSADLSDMGGGGRFHGALIQVESHNRPVK